MRPYGGIVLQRQIEGGWELFTPERQRLVEKNGTFYFAEGYVEDPADIPAYVLERIGRLEDALSGHEKLMADWANLQAKYEELEGNFKKVAELGEERAKELAEARITLGATQQALEGTLAVDDPTTLPPLVALALTVKGQSDPSKKPIPADALDRLTAAGFKLAQAEKVLEALTRG